MYLKYFEGKKDRFPNIKKIIVDDFLVMVGKDAKSNDYLTFVMANDDDTWLHVHGYRGSHVLIKSKESQILSQKILPTEALKVAFDEAIKASKAPKDSQVEVEVVKCYKKWVTKKPNSNDGQVETNKKHREFSKDGKNWYTKPE